MLQMIRKKTPNSYITIDDPALEKSHTLHYDHPNFLMKDGIAGSQDALEKILAIGKASVLYNQSIAGSEDAVKRILRHGKAANH